MPEPKASRQCECIWFRRGLKSFTDKSVDDSDRAQSQAMIDLPIPRLPFRIFGPPPYAVGRPIQPAAAKHFPVDCLTEALLRHVTKHHVSKAADYHL
jgi:hypothetical protein